MAFVTNFDFQTGTWIRFHIQCTQKSNVDVVYRYTYMYICTEQYIRGRCTRRGQPSQAISQDFGSSTFVQRNMVLRYVWLGLAVANVPSSMSFASSSLVASISFLFCMLSHRFGFKVWVWVWVYNERSTKTQTQTLKPNPKPKP